MKTKTIYAHQFVREEKELHSELYQELCNLLTKTFPKMEARLGEGPCGLSRLVYRIPTPLGLNEVEISRVSHGKTRSTILADLRTEGFFGDYTHSKLAKTLENFKLTEKIGARSKLTIPYTAITERDATTFPLVEAEETAKGFVKIININKVRSITFVVPNPYAGKYIEIISKKEADKAGLNYDINYNQRTKHLSFKLQ